MDFEEYSKKLIFYNKEVPNVLLELVKKVKFESYADLGCGDGSMLFALNHKGIFNKKTVYAIDMSELRIDKVKKINKDFICIVSDICNIKNIKDSSIDFITNTQVIEHVENDDAMIMEIKRILTDNGIVYLSTVFKSKYAWYFYRCNGKWVLDPTHLREYTKDNQLLDTIVNNGFEIIYTNKSLIKMPVIDFILRKIGFKQNIIENSFLNFLRRITLPIFGYYNWEIVFKSKSS